MRKKLDQIRLCFFFLAEGGGVLRFRFPRFYGFAGLFIGLCAHWKRIRLSVMWKFGTKSDNGRGGQVFVRFSEYKVVGLIRVSLAQLIHEFSVDNETSLVENDGVASGTRIIVH